MSDEYVFRNTRMLQKIKIPEGHKLCPICKGSGEVRRYYGGPGDRGQFMDCIWCGGLGYVEESFNPDDPFGFSTKETKKRSP